MKVAFRVDASLQIGSGHVMRCLALADVLRERGAESFFLCREHPGHLIELISSKGYGVHALVAGDACVEQDGTPHTTWLGTTQATDADACSKFLKELAPAWLIVDHYALDRRWQRQMRDFCRRLMVVDDLADRYHDCDLLLDQNLGRTIADYAGWVPGHCEILTGPMYALLRPEFAELRGYSLQRREKPVLRNLLISMGGVDQPNATHAILSLLRQYPLPQHCRISVVMGTTAPKLAQIREMALDMPRFTEVLVGITNMAQRMAECDFSIGAAGSTSWERCCLGVPSIILVLAENQRQIAYELNKVGATLAADLSEGETGLKNVLDRLFTTRGELSRLSSAAALICDGNGALRVGGAIER